MWRYLIWKCRSGIRKFNGPMMNYRLLLLDPILILCGNLWLAILKEKQLIEDWWNAEKEKVALKSVLMGNYGWDIRMYHADYSNDDWWRNDQSILYASTNMVNLCLKQAQHIKFYIGLGMLLSISFLFLGATAAKIWSKPRCRMLGALLIYPSFT